MRYEKNRNVWPISGFISETIHDRAIVTVQLACGLSNAAIFNDRGWSLTQSLRSRHYLMLNVSEIVWDTDSYACPTQGCHFKWSWVTVSDLANYSVTPSIARPLCDSWVSCCCYSDTLETQYGSHCESVCCSNYNYVIYFPNYTGPTKYK